MNARNSITDTFSDIRHKLPDRCYALLFCCYFWFIGSQFFIASNFLYSWSFYLAVCLPLLLVIRRHYGMIPRFHSLSLALGLLFGFTIFHALLLTPDMAGTRDTIRHTLTTGFFVLATFFVFRADASLLRRMLTYLLAVASLFAVLSILYHLGWRDLGDRLESFGQNDHPILGANVYAVFALSGFYFLHPAVQCTRQQRLMAVIAMMTVFLMVILTQSRGPLIAFSLAIALGLVLTRYFRLVITGGIAGIIIAGDFYYYSLHQQSLLLPVDHLYEAVLRLLERDSHRMAIWKIALDMIQDKPWTGHGMQAFFPYGFGGVNPHNIYLSAFYYTGIVGGLLLLLITMLSLYTALRDSSHPASALCMLLLCHSILACMTDQGQYVNSPAPLWSIFWLPIGMVWAISTRKMV